MSDLIPVPRVTLRQAFTVERLPLLSRLDYLAYRPHRRFGRRLVAKPARTLLNRLYRAGVGGRGALAYHRGAETRRIGFNARNLHFYALYLPQYALGYEPETCAVIERALGTDGTFFDIGANWGYFGFYLASDPAYRGRIVAFEPFPATRHDLTTMVAEAGLGDRIEISGIALSDQAGTATMSVSGTLRSGLARIASGPGVTVTTARLDDLDLPPPTVTKIDVEGHEAKVLAGAVETIAAHRPLILFESWRDESDVAAALAPFEILSGLGYRFYLPGWMVGAGARRLPSATAQPSAWPADLALAPVEFSQRLLLAGAQFNIVAIHAARIAEFTARLATPL